MEIQEIIIFNGTEYKLMGSGKYYLSQSSTNERRKNPKGLHVAIWEYHNGKEVPKGFHVHHKDGNTFNNDISNLECVSSREHAQKHFDKNDPKFQKFQKAGQEAAKEWHRSEEGRKWHSEHGKNVAASLESIEITCKECGKIFESKRTFTEYCSDKCGERWRGKHRRVEYTSKCVMCGNEFKGTKYKPSAPERKTCSKLCSNRLNYKNREEKSI